MAPFLPGWHGPNPAPPPPGSPAWGPGGPILLASGGKSIFLALVDVWFGDMGLLRLLCADLRVVQVDVQHLRGFHVATGDALVTS